MCCNVFFWLSKSWHWDVTLEEERWKGRCTAFNNNKEIGVLIRIGNNAVKLKKVTSANLEVITLVRALIVLRHLINTSFNQRSWKSVEIRL